MTVSEKILQRMKEKGISQKEFSGLAGIPESTISDWKKKGNTPKAEKLLDICRVLDMNIYDLLEDDPRRKADLIDHTIRGEERLLIECFRAAGDSEKKRILSYVQRFAGYGGTTAGSLSSASSALSERQKDQPASSTRSPEDRESFAADADLLMKKQLARKLRKLARLDRIRLDESEHASGHNLHLFHYLDYIGLDKLEYIKKYLSNIQPFMITEIKSQEKFESAICVLDQFYRISVYIKVDAKKNEEVIISFHENHKDGIARKNPIVSRNEYVYVFADSLGGHVLETDVYSINLFITRGVATFPVNVPATKYDDEGFLVRYSAIDHELMEIVNRYLEDLYTSDLDFSKIEVFSSLQQLSFTSYGRDVFSNISLLIDSLLIQSDYISKQVADAALCIYCGSLELLEKEKEELLLTLKERFSVNSIRSLPQILERVEMNLGGATFIP
ncbi:MAG: helix-turn-helix domain-containing protein [Lachnospiraceae bacterium]|nr:helix-turn-helix domain-containing protein [Lachnospiraceae bacterium]